MCKSQIRLYECGHWVEHRLSTCRGYSGRLDEESGFRWVACSGNSAIPSIVVPSPCAPCVKDEIITQWKKRRAEECAAVAADGDDTGPVYKHYDTVRRRIEAMMPRNEPFTCWRPKALHTWTALRPSPLRKQLKPEELQEDYDINLADFVAGMSESSASDTEMDCLEPSSECNDSGQQQKAPEGNAELDPMQIDPCLLADEAVLAVRFQEKLS